MKVSEPSYLVVVSIKDAAKAMVLLGEHNYTTIFGITEQQLNSIYPYHGLTPKQIKQYTLEGMVQGMVN